MTKQELILVAIASSPDYTYSPVQIQKLIFLIDKNAGHLLGGAKFDFVPYHYGPYDSVVYTELGTMENLGLIEVIYHPLKSWRMFKLTSKGIQEASKIREGLQSEFRQYIDNVNKWVISLTFPQLVSAIYKYYPDMKANSIFRD